MLSYDSGITGLMLKSGTTYSEQLFTDIGFVKGSATKLTLLQVLVKEGTLGNVTKASWIATVMTETYFSRF